MTTPLHEERFEFHLPRVNIGLADDFTVFPPGRKPFSTGTACIRDSNSFELSGNKWRLRRLIDTGSGLLPADTAYHIAAANGEKFTGDLKRDDALLEVPTAAITQEEAEKTADQIGWLLGLALGQQVTWNEVGIRKNHLREIVKARTVSLPAKASKSQPLPGKG